jgi:hypothetical protein
MNLQDMIGNYRDAYSTPTESIMPQVRQMMTNPLVDDEAIGRMSIGNDKLGEMMSSGYNARNATIKTYGDMMKEDVSNRMAGPTAIQHLATADKAMADSDPTRVAALEQAKKRGDVVGVQEGQDINAASMNPDAANFVMPKRLQAQGIRTQADLIRTYGANAHSILAAEMNADAREKAAGIQAGGEKIAASINANAAILNHQLTSSVNELKLIDNRIADYGNNPKNAVMKAAAETEKRDLSTRIANLQEQLGNLAGQAESVVDSKVPGSKRPAPAATKKSTATINPAQNAGNLQIKYPVGKVVTRGKESYIVSGHTPDGVPYTTINGKNYKLNVQ